MSLSVGDVAPEFSLPDQDKQVVSLADLRGRPVLVVFYPFAFSGICTGELCQLRDELAGYTEAGVQVVAVSTDPTFSLKAFREKEGFEFPLLSDFWPHGETARAYEVFNDKAGMALRGTFLVDAEGKIAFAEVNAPGDARAQSGWKDAVAALGEDPVLLTPRRLGASLGTGPGARSSAVERSPYKRVVGGSNPSAPTGEAPDPRSCPRRPGASWWSRSVPVVGFAPAHDQPISSVHRQSVTPISRIHSTRTTRKPSDHTSSRRFRRRPSVGTSAARSSVAVLVGPRSPPLCAVCVVWIMAGRLTELQRPLPGDGVRLPDATVCLILSSRSLNGARGRADGSPCDFDRRPARWAVAPRCGRTSRRSCSSRPSGSPR